MFISLPLAIGACLLKKTALCHTMLKVSAVSGTAWAAGGLYLAAKRRADQEQAEQKVRASPDPAEPLPAPDAQSR
ncbi:MAG: hypothetical protein AAFR17_14985 [Pseudomonadota bacterium]